MNTNTRKVLVCITPQSNSKRLIQFGLNTATSLNGELHVLHVEKGSHIFTSDASSQLLQQLFEYSAAKGATVHFICGENIPDTLKKFIKTNKITNIVLGAQSQSVPVASENVYEKLKLALPYVEIHILEREE